MLGNPFCRLLIRHIHNAHLWLIAQLCFIILSAIEWILWRICPFEQRQYAQNVATDDLCLHASNTVSCFHTFFFRKAWLKSLFVFRHFPTYCAARWDPFSWLITSDNHLPEKNVYSEFRPRFHGRNINVNIIHIVVAIINIYLLEWSFVIVTLVK